MTSLETGPTTRTARRAEAAAPPAPMGLANPAPLGLLGYGMSTVLLSLSNAGLYDVGPMVLSMAVFFGGVAQMIVAVLAFRRGETFTVTAFGGYAFLWLTFAFLLLGGAHGWWPEADSSTALGWYLLTWAVFSLGMTLGSLIAPRVLTGVLVLTVVLLTLLAVANWTDSSALTTTAGWEGILTGAAAMYTAFAFMINEVLGRTLLPVGAPLAIPAPPAPAPPAQRAATA